MIGSRLRLGQLEIDHVNLGEAVNRIAALVEAGEGGAVFTPNVDHVVRCEHDAPFRAAYSRASLCLADGTPLVWAARWLGTPLPEKVSGSDLVAPLMHRAAAQGWRVYLLGGAPGVVEAAAARLRSSPGVNVVGTDAPRIHLDAPDRSRATLERLREHQPHLVLVALGAPKQELWIDTHRLALNPAVALGIGASLDFVAGTMARAPPWMSRVGLEWAHRLAHEPRRLWRRYLVDDPRFLGILARDLRRRPAKSPIDR